MFVCCLSATFGRFIVTDFCVVSRFEEAFVIGRFSVAARFDWSMVLEVPPFWVDVVVMGEVSVVIVWLASDVIAAF